MDINKIKVLVGYDAETHEFSHETSATCSEDEYAMMGLGLLFPDWAGYDITVVVLLNDDPIWRQRGKWADLLPNYFPAKNPSGAW